MSYGNKLFYGQIPRIFGYTHVYQHNETNVMHFYSI
jgi:hypothetical protein